MELKWVELKWVELRWVELGLTLHAKTCPSLMQGTGPPGGGEAVTDLQAGLYRAVFQALSDKVSHAARTSIMLEHIAQQSHVTTIAALPISLSLSRCTV